MTPDEHVENLKASASFAAKRIALAEELRGLDDDVAFVIAFNSRGPCLSGSQTVFRHLDAARAHIKAALVALATQSLFPDDGRSL